MRSPAPSNAPASPPARRTVAAARPTRRSRSTWTRTGAAGPTSAGSATPIRTIIGSRGSTRRPTGAGCGRGRSRPNRRTAARAANRGRVGVPRAACPRSPAMTQHERATRQLYPRNCGSDRGRNLAGGARSANAQPGLMPRSGDGATMPGAGQTHPTTRGPSHSPRPLAGPEGSFLARQRWRQFAARLRHRRHRHPIDTSTASAALGAIPTRNGKRGHGGGDRRAAGRW